MNGKYMRNFFSLVSIGLSSMSLFAPAQRQGVRLHKPLAPLSIEEAFGFVGAAFHSVGKHFRSTVERY